MDKQFTVIRQLPPPWPDKAVGSIIALAENHEDIFFLEGAGFIAPVKAKTEKPASPKTS